MIENIYDNIIILSGAHLTTKKKNGILILKSKNLIILKNNSMIQTMERVLKVVNNLIHQRYKRTELE